MIAFFTQDTAFDLPQKRAVKRWLAAAIADEGRQAGALSVIFCSDDYLLQINRRYLQHDYYTDVITFDYTDGTVVAGDIFISVDTVKANAAAYGEPFERELMRVMVHGVLHLCGYDDHTRAQQALMRAREDFYIERAAPRER